VRAQSQNEFPEYLQLIAIVCIYMYKYTLKYGMTPYAPIAISYLGFILCHFLRDMEAGKVYAEHAFRLLKKHDCKGVEARSLFVIHTGVWHWVNPLQTVMPSLIEIYDMAMRAGQSEDGLLSIYSYLECAMYTGRELASIENDLVMYMNQMVDFKQAKALFLSKCLLQSVRNLRGKSPSTSSLTGGVMNEEECMKICREKNDRLMLASMYRRKMFLACYFAEHELNAALGLAHGEFVFQTLVGQTSIPVLAYVLSVSSYAMARQSKKKAASKYKQQATKYRRIIEQWSSHNPRCVPYLKVLDAERAALNGKVDSAFQMYKEAVTMTGRGGAIHEQALINERMAELYLDVHDVEEAIYRFEMATALYGEWKANRKVRLLQERLRGLVPLNVDAPPVATIGCRT
jgi:predicted ATPase